MAGVNEPISRGKARLPLTAAILLEGIVIALRSHHLISTGWTLAAFFGVIFPLVTLKKFADFRRS